MIDYEKLKIVYFLASKISLAKIIFSYSIHDGVEYTLSFPGTIQHEAYNYSDIDSLILKIIEVIGRDSNNLTNKICNHDGYAKSIHCGEDFRRSQESCQHEYSFLSGFRCFLCGEIAKLRVFT